jgi:hypothetical protein
MSSHHFVREGQEPALLISDPVDFFLAGPLLEWAPLVIVTSHALDHVLDWNIKVDVVITTPELVDNLREKLLSQIPVKIITSDQGTEIETAFYFLIASKHQAVSILANDAKFIIAKAGDFMDKLAISVLSMSGKYSGISSGIFKKWLPAGSRLQFYGLDKMPSSNNLRKSGEETEVIQDGIIELAHSSPFWVRETL